MDGANYRPAQRVLDRLRHVDFVAVVGPTAVGKTTIMKAAMEYHPELSMVVNNTSRKPRPGEREGIDYFFKSREAMEVAIKKGEYVQVAPTLFGDWYATAPEGYATNGVCMLAVVAKAIPVFRALPFKTMRTIFVLPPDWETWQTRLARHGFDAEQLQRRMSEALQSLEFALKDTQIEFVINADLATAAEDFATLVLGEESTERLTADQQRVNKLVRDLHKKLKYVM